VKKVKKKTKMKIHRGEGISPGVAVGKAYIAEDMIHQELKKVTMSRDRIPQEKDRFKKSLEESRKEIQDLIEKVDKDLGADESSIFQMHLGIISDKSFTGKILRLIEDESLTAESAVKSVVEHWEKRFLESSSQNLQMKMADILDIGKRLLTNLCTDKSVCDYSTGISIEDVGEDVILISRILFPSSAAFAGHKEIVGILAELGNKTSHSAVIAKSLGLPVVFGIPDLLRNVRNGDEIIIDGSSGIVFINPDEKIRNEYETIKKSFSSYRKYLEGLTDTPSITKDGREIELYANVGAYADVDMALKYGARGVGLYRTEMPFLIRNQFPSEDLQYSLYKRVIEKMEGRPVSIRTLDLGGDKILSYMPMPQEENPNLGWRAIRVFMDHPDLFKTQLKAILRASVGGDVKIIIPMVSDLPEVYFTRKILNEVKRELSKKGIRYNKNVQLGIMMEVPSAVILAHHLIEEVDFFSVGTNDLIQYTLAVDRNSEKVSKYFEPLNSAILYMLKRLVKITEQAGKDITLCGEVAGEPLYVPLLVGLGYRKLSVNPIAINLIKDIIHKLSFKDTKALVDKALNMKTAKDIRVLLEDYFSKMKKIREIYLPSY